MTGAVLALALGVVAAALVASEAWRSGRKILALCLVASAVAGEGFGLAMARCNAGAAVNQVGENPCSAASKACGEKLSQKWMEEPAASADRAPAINPCT